MPNTPAMDRAISNFCQFLSKEIIDYLKKSARASGGLRELIQRHEKNYLVPVLTTCALPSYIGEQNNDWRGPAEKYQSGMEAVLQTLYKTAAENAAIEFTLKEIFEIIGYQHEFLLLRPIFESVLNADKPPEFSKDPQKNKMRLFEQKTRHYFPISDNDLSQFHMAWPSECTDKELATLTTVEKIQLITTILHQHPNRIKNYNLLLQLTENLIKDPQQPITNKVYTEWLKACARYDGQVAKYSYGTSLLRWVEILECHLPDLHSEIQNSKELLDLFVHELPLFHDGEDSRICRFLKNSNSKSHLEIEDEKRIEILVGYLTQSAPIYQKRKSELSSKEHFRPENERSHPELQFVTRTLVTSCSTLFDCMIKIRPLMLPPVLAANLLNIWCRFGLLNRTESIIDYVLVQQAGNLHASLDRFITSDLENEFVRFLNLLSEGTPYVLVFFKRYPKLLARPKIAEVLLYNNLICKELLTQGADKAAQSSILSLLAKELSAFETAELLRILRITKEPNENCLAIIWAILNDANFKQTIGKNADLIKHCVLKNYVEPFSITLIPNPILSLSDLLLLLRTATSVLVINELLNKIKSLLYPVKSHSRDFTIQEYAAIDDLLRLRQKVVAIEGEVPHFPEGFMECFAKIYAKPGLLLKLLQFDANDVFSWKKNRILLIAVIEYAETRDYLIRELQGLKRPNNDDLKNWMIILPANSCWLILNRELSYQECIKQDPELRFMAISNNFDCRFSLALLKITKLTPIQLCGLIKKSHIAPLNIELLKEFIPVRYRVPIHLIHETLCQLTAIEFSEAVADRYQDYDHINSLFALVPNNEIALLTHLMECKNWQNNILMNIDLAKMVDWLLMGSIDASWLICLQKVFLAKIHKMLIDEQEPNKQIIEGLTKLQVRFGWNLEFNRIIYSDQKLKNLMTVSLVKRSLLTDFQESPLDEVLKFKLQLIIELHRPQQLSCDDWITIMNDPYPHPPAVLLGLLDAITGLQANFQFGKVAIDQAKIQKVTLIYGPERKLLLQQYLLQMIIQIRNQFEMRNGLGSLRSESARAIANSNTQIIEQVLSSLLDVLTLKYWLTTPKLDAKELKILLNLPVIENLLTDEILLAAMISRNWSVEGFTALIERSNINRLWDVASGCDDAEQEGLCLIRLTIANILRKQDVLLPEPFEEPRKYALEFISITMQKRQTLFQLSVSDAETLILDLSRLVLSHKPCSCDEMLLMLKINPHLPILQYRALQPTFAHCNYAYFIALLALNPSDQIQIDVMYEIVHSSKVINKLGNILEKINIPSLKIENSASPAGLIARAKWLSDLADKKLPQSCRIIRTTNMEFLQKQLLVIALIDPGQYNLLYRRKPDSAVVLGDYVYVDADWFKPLCEIDRLIRDAYPALFNQAWLISAENPYCGISPETNVIEPLQLSQNVRDNIKSICAKAFQGEIEMRPLSRTSSTNSYGTHIR